MAEEERLTKAERREQARAERKRAEEEAARAAKKKRATNTIVGVVITAIVLAVVANAIFNRPEEIEDVIVLQATQVEAAQEAAGCVGQDGVVVEPRTHYEPGEAPAADAIYGSTLRPPAGGPHFSRTGPVGTFTNSPADERAVTHNLEHGAIAVWFQADALDGDQVNELEAWADSLNASGFESNIAGGGIIVSVYENPMSSGKPIALRAWGVALDCDSFDETAFNGFVARFFGTRGIAPERTLSPFPNEVMRLVDDRPDDAEGEGETETEGDGEGSTEGDAPAEGEGEDS